MSTALTRLWLLAIAISAAVPLISSEKDHTDAENDGLIGRIKSVRTTSDKVRAEASQPDGFMIVFLLTCSDCDYDQTGKRIQPGDSATSRDIRDASGNTQEQVWENEKGEVSRRVEFSSGRKVRDTTYVEQQPEFTTEFTYDLSGNLRETHTTRTSATKFSSNVTTYDPQGNLIEQVDEGPGSYFAHYRQVFDTKTNNLRSFTGLDRDGLVRLDVSLQDANVASFWQAQGDPPTYGTGFIFDTAPTVREAREYKWTGSYMRYVFTFVDDKKRHPKQVTLFDTNGDLWIRADYEYEFDIAGNWTKRTVWEWTRDWGGGEQGRKLVEIDSRTLTYYSAAQMTTAH
jgi:YD repeat-containing protein